MRENEKIEEEEDAIPTVHPLRNCTPPAIEQVIIILSLASHISNYA